MNKIRISNRYISFVQGSHHDERFTTNCNSLHLFYEKQVQDKKVLLRERKRHTARRVASACYAALYPDGGGGPHPGPQARSRCRGIHPRSKGAGEANPSQVWIGGYPIPGTDEGYSIPGQDGGTPIPPPGPGMGYPHTDLGYDTSPHLDLGWSTPPQSAEWGTSQLDLGWGTPHLVARWGTPPKCGQTDTCENSTFPRASYADGKNTRAFWERNIY